MILEQRQDETVPWEVTLARADGDALTYTGAESMTCQVWAGDDQAVALTPTVTWLSAPNLLQVSIDASTLDEGDYQLRIRDNADVDVAWHTLRVLPAPGTADPEPVYGSVQDLYLHAPWVRDLAGEDDEAGFVEQRALARAWLDDTILRHYTPYGTGPMVMLSDTAVYLGAPGDVIGPSQWLRDQLDDDALIVTTTIREAVARYAASVICSAQLGVARDGESYHQHALRLRAEAETILATLVVQLDTDSDDEPDLSIDLGRVAVLRG